MASTMQNLNQEDYAFTMDVEVLQKVFHTNVAGAAYVAHAFLPLLEKSRKKTIVNISSTLGSMGADYGAYHSSYSISKAALNMLVRLSAFLLCSLVFRVAALMPTDDIADVQAGEGAS